MEEKVYEYCDQLAKLSKKELNTHFDMRLFDFDSFEIVNSYLIYRAVEDNSNTLIQVPNTKTKSKFYLPSIFMLALYNFIDNFIDDDTIYEIGDILQYSGDRYKIIEKSEVGFTLVGPKNTRYFPNKKQIRKYIITSANLKDRRVKTKFEYYKSFFREVIRDEIDYLPSTFKYKSVIVTDKGIIDELKKYALNGEEVHKAFPFQYITKNGRTTDNLPIDPLIYITNDYETVRNHILQKNIVTKTIMFIGKNKYEGQHLGISEDLRNQRIANCIFIGSADFTNFSVPNLHKWKWTLPEIRYFDQVEAKEINQIHISNKTFSNSINDFYELIKRIEDSFGIDLKTIHQFVTKLFPIVLPSNESRLANELLYLTAVFEKEGQDIVEAAFYEVDEWDFEEHWKSIVASFKVLIDRKREECSKFQAIKSINRIDYLVVPKNHVRIWQNETNRRHIRQVVSYSEFKTLKKSNKIVVFLGFYGYEHLKDLLYSKHKITVLLQSEEKEYFQTCHKRFQRETLRSIKDSDRIQLSNLSFREIESPEKISDLIARLFDQSNYSDCDNIEDVNSELPLSFYLLFEGDSEPTYAEGNKTVLLNTKGEDVLEKVKNLRVGDCIRIYNNSTKEELYEIATQSDDEDKFKIIEVHARLWKSELKKYYANFESLDALMENLNGYGLSISSKTTLRNWLNLNSKVKFPQKRKDLLILKKAFKSDEFNSCFGTVLKSRKAYNSIMIALGRDFSDEIASYIQDKKKGKMLSKFSHSQIRQIVRKNAREQKIKSINIAVYEE